MTLDPGSIIALTTVSAQLARTVVGFLRKWSTVDEELTRFGREIQSMTELLESVNAVIEGSPDLLQDATTEAAQLSTQRSLDALSAILEDVHEYLTQLDTRIRRVDNTGQGPRFIRNGCRALALELRTSGTNNLRSSVHFLTSCLNAALSCVQLNVLFLNTNMLQRAEVERHSEQLERFLTSNAVASPPSNVRPARIEQLRRAAVATLSSSSETSGSLRGSDAVQPSRPLQERRTQIARTHERIRTWSTDVVNQIPEEEAPRDVLSEANLMANNVSLNQAPVEPSMPPVQSTTSNADRRRYERRAAPLLSVDTDTIYSRPSRSEPATPRPSEARLPYTRGRSPSPSANFVPPLPRAYAARSRNIAQTYRPEGRSSPRRSRRGTYTARSASSSPIRDRRYRARSVSPSPVRRSRRTPAFVAPYPTWYFPVASPWANDSARRSPVAGRRRSPRPRSPEARLDSRRSERTYRREASPERLPTPRSRFPRPRSRSPPNVELRHARSSTDTGDDCASMASLECQTRPPPSRWRSLCISMVGKSEGRRRVMYVRTAICFVAMGATAPAAYISFEQNWNLESSASASWPNYALFVGTTTTVINWMEAIAWQTRVISWQTLWLTSASCIIGFMYAIFWLGLTIASANASNAYRGDIDQITVYLSIPLTLLSFVAFCLHFTVALIEMLLIERHYLPPKRNVAARN